MPNITKFNKKKKYIYLTLTRVLHWSESCPGALVFAGLRRQAMCAKRTSRARSAKSLAAGVQGPLKGPGSSRVLDALWCYISLILNHFTTVIDQ